MMGFGPYYGYEGCAPSASNLSPLAPPFTVDRSIPKTNSNSPVDLAVEAPYSMAAPLNPSLHNWIPPHYLTSRSDLFAKPNPEDEPIRGSKGYNTYFGAQPINPSSSASLPSDPNPITANGIKTNLVEAKPYYPSFAMQTIQNDSPAGLPDRAGYDLLSSSYASALNGSSHEDCADGLTGVEYTSPWGDVWNRPVDWNCGKQVEIDGNFCPKEIPNASGSSNYENYMNQGSLASKAFDTFEELPYENEMRSREKVVGSVIAKKDDKSFSGQNPKLKPIGYPKTSILGSAILPESCSTEPSLEHATNPRNHKRSYGSYNEGLTQHDFGMKLSTPAAFLMSPTRLPPIGTGYLAPNSGSMKPSIVSEDMANTGSVWDNMKKSPFYRSSEAKDLFDARQTEKCLVGTSGVKNNELRSSKKVSNITLENFLEPKSDIQKPQIRPDGYGVTPDLNEAVSFVGNFSEPLDHYNTVVDSPCWKGVPFCFPPFKVPEATASQHPPFKVPEATTPQQLNLQNPPGFVLDCARLSSQLSGENSSLFKNESDNAMEGGFHYSKQSQEPSIDCIVQHFPEEGETENGKKVASVNSVNDDSKDGCQVLSGAPEFSSRSPSVENAKPLNLPLGQSTSKIDVRVLIRVIHDISTMLLYHCSNDEFEVTEKDCQTLKCVISNLETCMRKNLERGPAKEPMLSLGGNSQFLGHLPDPRKSQLDNQHGPEEMKDQVPDIDPPRGDEDRVNDDNMIQAIKKVLSENFVGEEETQPQARLYKNLWLEAEAAICAIRYKARFNRMKIEMEKDGLQKAKDVLDNATDSKKLPSYKVSPVLSSINNAKPEPNCGTTSVISNQDSSTSGCADDVMTRLRVLKCWSDDSKSINAVNELDSSNSQVSQHTNSVEKVEIDAEDSPIPDVSIQDSHIISPNVHSDDVMSSLKSRVGLLKSRVGLLKSRNAIDMVEKLGSEENDSPIPDVPIQDSCVINFNSHSDDVMSRYDILKSREDVLNSRDAIDEVEKLRSEEKDSSIHDVPIHDSRVISLNSHSDDVMSRYNILKSREDVCNSQDAMDKVEKLDSETNDSPVPVSDDIFSRYHILRSRERREDVWDSRDATDSNKVSALASETKDSPIPAVSDDVMSRYQILKSRGDGSSSIITVNEQDVWNSQDSVGSNTVEKLAREANDSQTTSVLTRFHILKTRAENSSFMEPETEQLLDVDLGFASRSNYWSISTDGLGEDNLTVDGKPEIPGNQLSGDWYDCSSSDWEHVLKEDVLGQN